MIILYMRRLFWPLYFAALSFMAGYAIMRLLDVSGGLTGLVGRFL